MFCFSVAGEAVEIRSCLNFFFPFFVKCKWSLPLFEEAFLPTMEILFEAPPYNPISQINQKNVIKVLCDLTNPNYVSEEVVVWRFSILFYVITLVFTNSKIKKLRHIDRINLAIIFITIWPYSYVIRLLKWILSIISVCCWKL